MSSYEENFTPGRSLDLFSQMQAAGKATEAPIREEEIVEEFAPMPDRNLVEGKTLTKKRTYTTEYHLSTNCCAEIIATLSTQSHRVMADMAMACKDRCLCVKVCLRAWFWLRSPLARLQ
uniref:Uncharacterized protein n=1 Tax=Glossina austeni TaxID=7395 RepID=A0A1A9VCI8_GLOAU